MTHPERKFNGSIIKYNGQLLLAYRQGWDAAQIKIVELGEDLRPSSPTRQIELKHPKCAGGREDPRLFLFRENLHLSFHGVQYGGDRHLQTSVLVADLSDGLGVRRIWEPVYGKRTRIEKNWQFFECDNDLFTIYQNHPHKVLAINSAAGIVTTTHETASPQALSKWGVIRGGAPPVRVEDEYYHWYHSWKKENNFYHYTCGVYCFEAKPPFRITRYTTKPLWEPDYKKVHLNIHHDKSVIFPCGAILQGDSWLVSAGHQDSEVLISQFDRKEIDDRMVSV